MHTLLYIMANFSITPDLGKILICEIKYKCKKSILNTNINTFKRGF